MALEGQDVYRADLWAQYLAQVGYVVLEPNYRGSTGYGEHFRNLNVEDSNVGWSTMSPRARSISWPAGLPIPRVWPSVAP
jgi:hypothetical protein